MPHSPYSVTEQELLSDRHSTMETLRAERHARFVARLDRIESKRCQRIPVFMAAMARMAEIHDKKYAKAVLACAD